MGYTNTCVKWIKY